MVSNLHDLGYEAFRYRAVRKNTEEGIIIIIIIIKNKDRIAATMYPLGIWFVPGMFVWLPCIKETMI